MIWLWIVLGALAVIAALVFALGALVAREHVATVASTYPRPPRDVWEAITGFERMSEWRDGVQRVELLEPLHGKARIREHGKFGPMTFVVEESVPERRLVLGIADTDQGFGGKWIYELAPVAGGTQLRITEDGWIDSALFRFFAHWVFGYEATLRGYHASLAKKLGA